MKVRIADHVAHLLIADGIESACWGDGVMCEASYAYSPDAHIHPLDRIAAAVSSCERAPDLFRKTLIAAHDSNGNPRTVRCFWLIGTPRPLPTLKDRPNDQDQ
ncbi:MAG: hypothetical protein J7496_08760 [Novosphingobium sp.]|nr:hypothetical protein [Novosphingobium sp.]